MWRVIYFHFLLNIPMLCLFSSGEVYVLDDGGEVDLDLGNYERFLDVTLHRDNNITTGKIYKQVIEKEREGYYLGKTVQGWPKTFSIFTAFFSSSCAFQSCHISQMQFRNGSSVSPSSPSRATSSLKCASSSWAARLATSKECHSSKPSDNFSSESR